MVTISLIISIAALIMLLLTRIKVHEIDETLNESYGRANVIEGDILDIKTALDKIRFNRLKSTRGNVFNMDLKIHDALKLHPDAPAVFKSFHLGGCSACSVGADETIEGGAAAHNIDLNNLLTALNKLE